MKCFKKIYSSCYSSALAHWRTCCRRWQLTMPPHGRHRFCRLWWTEFPVATPASQNSMASTFYLSLKIVLARRYFEISILPAIPILFQGGTHLTRCSHPHRWCWYWGTVSWCLLIWLSFSYSGLVVLIAAHESCWPRSPWISKANCSLNSDSWSKPVQTPSSLTWIMFTYRKNHAASEYP